MDNDDKDNKLAQIQQQISEDLQKDERLRHFVVDMTEEDKDKLTCDEVFALYLRHVSKQVNESYYRTVLRFVLLYRECLNEYGWLKRRDHYHKAYHRDEEDEEEPTKPINIDDYDEVLSKLKREEQQEEREENERIERIKANRRAAKIAKRKKLQQLQLIE